jgi:hypothetical protein
LRIGQSRLETERLDIGEEVVNTWDVCKSGPQVPYEVLECDDSEEDCESAEWSVELNRTLKGFVPLLFTHVASAEVWEA